MSRHCIHAFQRRGLFAPLALLRLPALRPVLNLIQDLFQGRLLLPALALGVLLLAALPQGAGAQAPPESTKVDFTQTTLCPRCGKPNPLNVYICRYCGADLLQRGNRKRPLLAAGLSLILPGSGQFYNQEYLKGLGFMALCYSGIVIAWNSGNSRYSVQGTSNFFTVEGLGFFIYEVGWFVSVGEAWASAKRINERKGYDTFPVNKEEDEPCPKCGTMNTKGAYTCWRCGFSLQGQYLKKNPVAAIGMSLILLGGGQFYTGGRRKGAILLGTFATGFVVMYTSPYPSKRNAIGARIAQIPYFYSLADAPVSALLFNRKKIRKNGNMTQLGLIFVPDPRNPRRLQPGVGLRAVF